MKNIFHTLAFAILAASLTLSGLYARGAAGDSQAKTDRFPQAGPTKVVTDHAGHEVEIPAKPQRIASLNTMSTTAMLWELDPSLLIGTATRLKTNEGNRPYIRSVEELWGVRFQDTKLVNYGKKGSDLEQVKVSKPDLIIGTTSLHAKVYDQLSAIAPTVLIDYLNPRKSKVYGDLAAWIGHKDTYDAKEAQYQEKLAKVKAQFSKDPATQTFVYSRAIYGKAKMWVSQHYGSITKVAYDLGFKPLAFIQENVPNNAIGSTLSAEFIGDISSADYFLSLYIELLGENIESTYTNFDNIAPGWRDSVTAYKNGTYVVFNDERAWPITFASYNYILDQFAKHVK